MAWSASWRMACRAWSCSMIRSRSSVRAEAASARAASASACAAWACPAISSAACRASPARVSASSRAFLSRTARLSAACFASSASCTCAWISLTTSSGSATVARASASASAASRSTAASCSARSRVAPAVLIAVATGVRSAWASWCAVSPVRVFARQAFSGLCAGCPGASACSQYTGAGPLVPRRGAGVPRALASIFVLPAARRRGGGHGVFLGRRLAHGHESNRSHLIASINLISYPKVISNDLELAGTREPPLVCPRAPRAPAYWRRRLA